MSTPNPDSQRTLAPDALPAREAAGAARERPQAALLPRPELAGYRLVYPGETEVYLVDPAGFRRRIPNRETYSRLFRDGRGVVTTREAREVARRPDLAQSALLISAELDDSIYLLDDGRKRLITSSQVMDKYWFNWGRVSLVRRALVDALPNGEIWE
jgi:hypothetical protein